MTQEITARLIDQNLKTSSSETDLTDTSWRDAYSDRDLGWLQFNSRVLHEALDDRNPGLERIKFLAIFTSNLDEFFMKRIGLLRTRSQAERLKNKVIGPVPVQQRLQEMRQVIIPMLKKRAQCFRKELKPLLAEHNIHLLDWDQLTDSQREKAHLFFNRNVYPALTPLALDPGHPFP